MADLGNLKIKDTYQLLLQTDAGGNLQKLDGSSPNPFIINQNLRYLDGTTHPSGFVLTSDGSGNASWSAVAFSGDVYISGGSIEGTTIELNASSGGTVSVPGLSWSSSTSGHISNSGLTGNVGIGTSTPNKPLTVVGDISGTTDLYLGSSTHTASTITAQEQLTIRGREVDNDFMVLKEDTIFFSLDGAQSIKFTSPTEVGAGGVGSYAFNTSGLNYDFKITGEDNTPIFNLDGADNRIRIQDHLTIGANAAISHTDAVKWGLAVTGSSLFYSGGTSISTNAITAVGDISGTTDLYIGDNIRGLRGQFGNLPSAAGANRDLEIKGDNNVYIRLQSTTNANQTIEFMNDQEPDFLIYNKHTDGGLYIASDDKTFLVIGANDADTIDLYGNTIISGNTTLSGNTSYSGTISGTGSVTAVGGFVGEVTGNAATATKIASITNTDIVQLAGSQTLTGTKTLNSFKGTAGATVTNILDEDAMGSNSATALATQQSIKAYADTKSVKTGNTSLVTVGTVTTGIWASNRRFTVSATDPLGDGKGDIVYLGEETVVAGSIYYYSPLGSWLLSDASADSTSTGLLGVALTDNSGEGMLLRGMVTLSSNPGNISLPVYLSETAGRGTTTIPTTADAVVRVIGYSMVSASNQIWFDPDKTWVELSS